MSCLRSIGVILLLSVGWAACNTMPIQIPGNPDSGLSQPTKDSSISPTQDMAAKFDAPSWQADACCAVNYGDGMDRGDRTRGDGLVEGGIQEGGAREGGSTDAVSMEAGTLDSGAPREAGKTPREGGPSSDF